MYLNLEASYSVYSLYFWSIRTLLPFIFSEVTYFLACPSTTPILNLFISLRFLLLNYWCTVHSY